MALQDYKQEYLLKKLRESSPEISKLLDKVTNISFNPNTMKPSYFALLEDEGMSDEEFKRRFSLSKTEAYSLMKATQSLEIPKDKEIAQEYVKENKGNIADMEDAELRDMLEAYDMIGENSKEFNKNLFEKTVRESLKKATVDRNPNASSWDWDSEENKSYLDEMTKEYINHYYQTGNLMSPPDAGVPNIFRDINPSVSHQISEGNFLPQGFYPEESDVKSIKDILAGREEYRGKERDIEDYLTRLETELPAETEELMRGETERSLKQFQDVETPYLQQVAGSRGQFHSGAYEDLLSTSALGIQSGLESMRVGLMSEDIQFIGNAAYKEKVRQLLQSSTDLSQSLEQERSSILTQKGQTFQSQQAELNRQQEERLQEQRYQQQLKAQEAQYRRQQQQLSAQQRGQWLQTGANILGTVAGSYVGSKFGSPSTVS